MPDQSTPRHILPVIVFSQFAGTSLWFAGNAILPELISEFGFPPSVLGSITSAVQFGFIIGTLLFALLAIADRFSPRIIFLLSALGGAILNTLIPWSNGDLNTILVLRFATGFALAGIYPVGMKIASGWYKGSLGKALGYLVGALVLGTAFPHLIAGLQLDINWRSVLWVLSLLAVAGGMSMILFVPDGPYQKKGQHFDLKCVYKLFSNRPFRLASLGYFGHMWELYAFWAFVPVIVKSVLVNKGFASSTSLLSFGIIAIGALGCVVGGYLTMRVKEVFVARIMLTISGFCALFSPLLLVLPVELVFFYLLVWGFAVVADSPQLSFLTAKTSPPFLVGTGLALVTSLGFALTIGSIQLLNRLVSFLPITSVLIVLSIGPVIGIFNLLRLGNIPIQAENGEVPIC